MMKKFFAAALLILASLTFSLLFSGSQRLVYSRTVPWSETVPPASDTTAAGPEELPFRALMNPEPELKDEALRLSSYTDVSLFGVHNDEWVENLLDSMTIEEKAGQMVFPYTYGRYTRYNSRSRLEKLVKELKVGGFIFMRGDLTDYVLMTNRLQRMAEVPLLFASDFERGVAQRVSDATVFPFNMAVGAADDTLLTEQMGKIIATEGRALGVYQNYAPVADVNSNPLNPIINVRSYGETSDLVARHASAFTRGLQNGGMIATAKHFPGHGNTNMDSHMELAVIDVSADSFRVIDLEPFRKTVESGVMSVMIGHLGIKALQTEGEPATLSSSVVTGLLKDELGFSGLIVTDAMNMHGVTKLYDHGEAAARAVQAGNDIILFPAEDEEALQGIIDAVNDGVISEDRLDYSVRKILLAKRWAGLDENRYIDAGDIPLRIGADEHWETAQRIADKSITLVKDSLSLIPLRLSDTTSYTHISVLDNDTEETAQTFGEYLKQKQPSLSTVIIPKYSERRLRLRSVKEELKERQEAALEQADSADVILLSVYLRVRDGLGKIGLDDDQVALIEELYALKKPVALLSHGTPYLLGALPESAAYLCNYGSTKVSELSLSRALTGEIPISGRLPVSIPGTSFRIGHGFDRDTLGGSPVIETDYNEGENPMKQVDQVMQFAIADSVFPGAVLLVYHDGEIIHEKAYGHFTYDEDSKPVTVHTIFDLASVSKVAATTTAAMVCVDRGLFSLDDKVSKYIPDFAQGGKEEVTIKNLMVHNSGLPPFKRYYKFMESADSVYADIYATEVEYEPGTKKVYSDLGFITLAKIIEEVSGKPLDEFCRTEIFEPLGMNNTMYNPPEELHDNIAPTELDNYWRNRLLIGEVHDENASLLGGVAGHAGLFSTAYDLSKLLRMLIKKGFYHGKQFISEEVVAKFVTRESDLSSRAIGWDTKWEGWSSAGPDFSEGSYGHTGYTGTSLWTDPKKDVYVVLLTNRVHPTRENTRIGRFRPKLHSAVIKALGLD